MEHQHEVRAKTPEAPQTNGDTRQSPSADLAPLHPVLYLQQRIGNRAVQRQLAGRDRAAQAGLARGGNPAPPGHQTGAAAQQGAGWHGTRPVTAGQALVQPQKLGKDDVTQTLPLASATTPSVPYLPTDPLPVRSAPFQRKRAVNSRPLIANDRAFGDKLATSHGEPLAEGTRKHMEVRFGHDFSGVRVHTDASAAEMCASLQADAFTAGRDIYFARGQYSPGSREGQRLLAHELTHSVQQQVGSSPAALQPGARGVSSPDDPQETEAERVSDAALSRGPDGAGEPKTSGGFNASGVTPQPATKGAQAFDLSHVITPAPAGVIQRQGQRQRPPALYPGDAVFATSPDVYLFLPVTPISKKWDLLKPTFTPLVGGTFIVDGIPISYNLQGEAAAQSNAVMTFGPGTLEDIQITVTGAEAERLRRQRSLGPWLWPGLGLPPDPTPHGSFQADAMLRFNAYAAASVTAFARLDAGLGVFGNALNAGAFAGLKGSAKGLVETNGDTFVDFTWSDGAISKLSVTLDFTAALTLAFHLEAFAGVWVELQVPEIPVVTDLSHKVQSWPILGWVVPDLTRWKWRKEYKKDWPLLDKSYTWDLQQRFVIGTKSASGSIVDAEGFRMDRILTELQANQKAGELKDDPDGPGRERRNSDTAAISAAKASALAQISSAKRAADREKQANSRLLASARRAVTAKAPSGSTGTPALAAIGPPSDPVTDLKQRGEKLNDAVASTEQLRQRVNALDAPASAVDGVSRNEARSGFESVAKNADALGDKINKNEEVFAVPAAAEPSDADYQSMRAARLKAYDAFDDCFDVVRTEKLFADDQVLAAGTDADLRTYRDAAMSYQGRALTLWTGVQKLESDMERAREWYEKGDYALGAKVFGELEIRAVRIKDDGEALKKDRPVGDWDDGYVELSKGHLRLRPEYQGKATRRYFYPHDYSTATKSRMMQEIGSFHTGADGQIYWEYARKRSPRGDFWWLLNDENEQPTLDHTKPTVVAHWNNHGGRKTSYAARSSYYDFEGASLVVVPKRDNSSAGGREDDSYTPLVTRSFRGSKT